MTNLLQDEAGFDKRFICWYHGRKWDIYQYFNVIIFDKAEITDGKTERFIEVWDIEQDLRIECYDYRTAARTAKAWLTEREDYLFPELKDLIKKEEANMTWDELISTIEYLTPYHATFEDRKLSMADLSWAKSVIEDMQAREDEKEIFEAWVKELQQKASQQGKGTVKFIED